MEIVTVTTKGQITIPADLRRRLRIAEGTKLIVTREGEGLRLIPVPKLSRLASVDEEVFEGRKPSEELLETRREWTQEFDHRLKEA